MTFYELEVFVAVAKAQSLSKAARELHTTQSPVSRHIKTLQDDLGTMLIRNTGRGISLTAEGRQLLPEAEAILRQVQGIRNKFRAASGRETPFAILNIGGSHSPSAWLLPSLTSRFKTQHPNLRPTLFTGTSVEMEDMIVEGRIEIGIISNPRFAPELVAEPYRREKLMFVCAPHHPAAEHTKINPFELAQLPLITTVGKSGESRVEEQLSHLFPDSARLRVEMRFESPGAVKSAVRSGEGIGVLHEDLVAKEIARGELKQLRPQGLNLAGQNYLIYSRQRPLSVYAERFLDFLRTQKNDAATALRPAAKQMSRIRAVNG